MPIARDILDMLDLGRKPSQVISVDRSVGTRLKDRHQWLGREFRCSLK